jgi:molecular chaperone HscB
MTDPFSILGVEPTFDLDLNSVERRHRELSRALHPDRYSGRPATERRRALSRAIEVNAAWRKLRDPIGRAEALLQRLGVVLAEGEEPKATPELLMDMIDKRESLSEARRARDLTAVERLAAEVRQRQDEVVGELGRGFSSAVAGQSAPQNGVLGILLEKLGELRYCRRFLEEAAAVEEELA